MVVARIERYKLEHPTMFAWEIKEKLLREGIRQSCFSIYFARNGSFILLRNPMYFVFLYFMSIVIMLNSNRKSYNFLRNNAFVWKQSATNSRFRLLIFTQRKHERENAKWYYFTFYGFLIFVFSNCKTQNCEMVSLFTICIYYAQNQLINYETK